MQVKIFNQSNHPLPAYQTRGAAGMDLYADLEEDLVLKPMERALVPTGIYLEVPEGYEAQVRARSGLAIKKGISLVNGVGTIDSDYRGQVQVILINLSKDPVTIMDGERIAQLVFSSYARADLVEVEAVGDLEKTSRQGQGFGHTGV